MAQYKRRYDGVTARIKLVKATPDSIANQESEADLDAHVHVPRVASLQGPSANSLYSFSTHRDAVSYIFGKEDFSGLPLKKDHASRPLWINPDNGHIILESFSPIAEQAQDFLVAIAEPVTRPNLMHEYKLTPYSMYAAVSVGLETESIIEVLNRLSKSPLPESIIEHIRTCTVSYGKIKLLLKENRYYVESTYPDILQKLLRDPIISQARIVSEGEKQDLLVYKVSKDVMEIPGVKKEEPKVLKSGSSDNKDSKEENMEDDLNEVVLISKDDDEEDDDTVHSFEIKPSEVENVRKRCNDLDFPMLEEYDFRNDALLPNLEIDLKPITTIRPYQEKSLSKMFGNGRARSGLIVLPCGAGKTLVGITATCTIKKSTLVLCTSGVSVEQWKSQYKHWSNISDKQIAVFSSETKEKFATDAGIVISTYTMVANTGKRSYESNKMMEFLQNTEWGFLLLDEVHVVPANVFRRVLTRIAAHTKLGLTATLLREDDKITDLNFLIGPKLYEANWMDLSKQGHIATVQCAEVWCPMTPEFYKEYLSTSSRKRHLLYVMNPNKFRICQYLIDYHESRGDKIIVFSDNVFALKAYALKLKKPFIYGATGQHERMQILHQFQYNPNLNTMFLSKVGDTSIDLPEATCLIQVSSHYGSRRQEAQRLGRILRAKRRNDEGFNAFFYSLVSKDTEEMYYSTKRQQFLIDQGYAFKVITKLDGMEQASNLVYSTKKEQRELLQSVLMASENELNEDDIVTEDTLPTTLSFVHRSVPGQVSGASITSLSGADDMAYIEYNRNVSKGGRTVSAIASKSKAKAPPKESHPLFKQWRK